MCFKEETSEGIIGNKSQTSKQRLQLFCFLILHVIFLIIINKTWRFGMDVTPSPFQTTQFDTWDVKFLVTPITVNQLIQD